MTAVAKSLGRAISRYDWQNSQELLVEEEIYEVSLLQMIWGMQEESKDDSIREGEEI